MDEAEWREMMEDDHCPFLDPKQPVDYRRVFTPSSYHCADCQRCNIKLWMDRDPQLPFLKLCCITCIARRANVALNYLHVQSDGQLWGEVWGWKYWTYETPDFVPGIPVPANDTFYRWEVGYRPAANAWGWWVQLPVW
jgi:hypothetical protein